MTKSYNEIFNAEQKQKNELIYAANGMYEARLYSHLSTKEEYEAVREEYRRRSRRARLENVERASSPYSKGYIQADCDIFYDVPGKGRSAVFVDDHGEGYTVDNLPKDFDPKSCLFSFKYDEQTGKICSAITVEHYNDKGYCDSAWFLDKEPSGKYEAYSFSSQALANITYDRNRAIRFGEHSAPGKWPVFKAESREEIDSWEQKNMGITLMGSDIERYDRLMAKLDYAKDKLMDRELEGKVSVVELAAQAEEARLAAQAKEARAHQSATDLVKRYGVETGYKRLAELLFCGDLKAAQQLAEKLVQPEPPLYFDSRFAYRIFGSKRRGNIVDKLRAGMQKARSAFGRKKQKVQEALSNHSEQVEKQKVREALSNHEQLGVKTEYIKMAELLFNGDLEAAQQSAEKIVKPESQDKAAGKTRAGTQEARSASGRKEQKVQEALARCDKALEKGIAPSQGERQKSPQEEKNEKGFVGKLKPMMLRKLKGNSGH